MGFFNKFVTFFFPHLILKENEVHGYDQTERETAKLNLLVILPLITVTYVLHYFYFDKAMGLTESSSFWFYFRFGMAALSGLGFLLYLKVFHTTQSFYKLYGVITTSAVVILQAYATNLYPEAPFVYPFVFVLVSILILRLTVVQNILFCIGNLTISLGPLLDTPNSPMDIYSASFITLVITLFISARNLSSIQLYKTNLEKLKAQKQLIERQIEIVDHLRGFLPKQIFKRFHELSSVRQYSTTYALDEILRPRNKQICCLFSDIRGYTQQSKDQQLLEKQLLPMIKESSSLIEDHSGIPRKIGDLIFAYYDESSSHTNILNSFNSSLEMALKQAHSNGDNPVNRSIILSFGDAIVGNIGGSGSAIEITAMGTPSNECARIDEFVKKNTLFYNKIIFAPSFFSKLMAIYDLKFETYIFNENDSIRDFEEINELQYIDFSQAKSVLKYNDTQKNKVGAA